MVSLDKAKVEEVFMVRSKKTILSIPFMDVNVSAYNPVEVYVLLFQTVLSQSAKMVVSP